CRHVRNHVADPRRIHSAGAPAGRRGNRRHRSGPGAGQVAARRSGKNTFSSIQYYNEVRMNHPDDRRYTPSHEWVKAEEDILLVGITDNAQDQLGDLVFVGDFKVGAHLKAGETAGVVESVKAASDIYAPVAGEIIAF